MVPDSHFWSLIDKRAEAVLEHGGNRDDVEYIRKTESAHYTFQEKKECESTSRPPRLFL